MKEANLIIIREIIFSFYPNSRAYVTRIDTTRNNVPQWPYNTSPSPKSPITQVNDHREGEKKSWRILLLCSQVSQRRRTRHTRQAAAILGTLVSDCPTRQVTTLALTTLTTIMRPTSRPSTWTWTWYRHSLHPTITRLPPHRSFTIPIWTSTTPCLCELTNNYITCII